MDLSTAEKIKQLEEIIKNNGDGYIFNLDIVKIAKSKLKELQKKSMFDTTQKQVDETLKDTEKVFKESLQEESDMDTKEKIELKSGINYTFYFVWDKNKKVHRCGLKPIEQKEPEEIEFVVGGVYDSEDVENVNGVILIRDRRQRFNLLDSKRGVILWINWANNELEVKEHFGLFNYKYTGRTLQDLIKDNE